MKTRFKIEMVGLVSILLAGCIDENKQAMNESDNGPNTMMAVGGTAMGTTGGQATDEGMTISDPGGAAGEEQPDTMIVGGSSTPDLMEKPNCGNEDALAPNQDIESAAGIESGFSRKDLFRCPDTSDWYKLAVTTGRNVRIALQPDPADAPYQLELLGENGAQLDSGRRDGDAIALDYTPDMDRDVYIRVGARGVTAGYYALTVSGQCRLDSDCADGQVCDRFDSVCEALPERMCGVDANEPNNTDATATAIEAPVSGLAGVICTADRDWFAFEANDGDSFEMLISFPQGEDLDVHVINATTGQVIDRAISDRDSNPERLDFSYLPAGQYRVGLTLYLRDEDEDRDVDYTIDFVGRSGACQADRDCVGEGLPRCIEGVCQPAEANAGLGETCARREDCGPDADLCYTGGSGGHDNFCTIRCRSADGCGALGDGAECNQISRREAVCFPGCQNDNDCSAFRRCNGGRCVVRGNCRVDADCEDGTVCRAIRNGDLYCGVPLPDAQCGADAAYDPNNGRAEATDLALGQTIENAQICDDDDDWYAVTIPPESAGYLFEASVSFREGVDIDLYVYDSAGNPIGESTTPDNVVETVSITLISPGQYFIRVDQFSSDRLEDTAYTMTAEAVDNEDRCTIAGNECAGTRPLRMVCDEMTGACSALEGNGEVALGQFCDSSDDCASADGEQRFCWPPTFLQDRDNIEQLRWVGSNICTHWCRGNGDCQDVPGSQCQRLTRRGDGVCLPPEGENPGMRPPPGIDPDPGEPDQPDMGGGNGGRSP